MVPAPFDSNTARADHAPPPRVSMILLAFEQERFVAEAIQSAFDQDYPNLEIVLSDHGSGDRTWEIMTGMAEAYRGPHRLRLIRSASTLGVLGHGLEAIDASEGRLIVSASGDDVSRSDRVSFLVRRWLESKAQILWSAFDRIDEEGRVLPPARPAGMIHDIARYFPGGGVSHVRGATAAYDRGALDALPRPGFRVMSEDFYLSLMLGLRGAKFERIDEALVHCRFHRASLSTRAGTAAGLAARERAVEAYSAQAARILRFALANAPAPGSPPRVDRARLRADCGFHEARAGWRGLDLPHRLASLRHVRRIEQLRWMLPRLFGERVLALLQRSN